MGYAIVNIAILAPDVVRVRAFPKGRDASAAHGCPPVPYALDPSHALGRRALADAGTSDNAQTIPTFKTLQTQTAVVLKTEVLTVGVMLDNGAVFIADAEDHLLRVDVDMAWGPGGEIRHRTALAPDEHIFGLGERATAWNRRGRRHYLWNTDPAGYANDDDPINLNIPVYIGVHPEGDGASSYLVFYENPYYAEFDLGASADPIADHRFAGGELRYYIIAGGDGQRLSKSLEKGGMAYLIERYTELTGRHDLPPLWMLGYHQCRWSYYPEARVRKLAQDFRDHEVPCDVIHLDIHYMDGYRVFTWDRDRFPDLPQLAADLRERGFKLINIIDPGVKQDPGYRVYEEGLEGDHFCKLPNGKVLHAPVWPGNSAFPDFTAPRTRAWWARQYKPLIDAGIAGFWNDMNEPATFLAQGDPTLPDSVRHDMEGRGGDHREAHNVYGMQMARASREGLRKLCPDKRPVLITRAGWAGVQRYATSWTGDNESTWNALRLTVPMVLGLGLSGVGFTGPDTGGFAGEADGELFTRWIQMTAFMPFFRAHTAAQTPDQEPWSYGEPYLSIVRRFIQLRYELLPYLYTATWQMAERGWPMVRPVWWHDASVLSHVWDLVEEVDDAFLCGDALLVAPVGEPGAITREVKLPSGAWYDFWTNRVHRGPVTIEQAAPLETIPLFIREGTVLPMGEFAPSVEQRLQKFLRLSVYPLIREEERERISLLYEDAGEGFAYRDGESRVSRFVMQCSEDKVEIAWEKEGAYIPPYEHVELTLNGLKRVPREVLADGVPFPMIKADPVRHTVLMGVPLFETLTVIL
jgi:alpha-glucosidase